jgi:hypothetical protein
MMTKIRVYCMNDFSEYWAGESMEACAAEAKEQTGVDYPEEGYGMELSDEEMNRFKIYDDDGTVRTMAEQLARDIAEGVQFPCCIASDGD